MFARLREVLSAALVAGAVVLTAPTSSLAGLESQELAELERLLARLGFYPGAADGVIDDKARDAIRGYQEFAVLPADGEPSEALLAELRDVVRQVAELAQTTAKPPAEPPAKSPAVAVSAVAAPSVAEPETAKGASGPASVSKPVEPASAAESAEAVPAGAVPSVAPEPEPAEVASAVAEPAEVAPIPVPAPKPAEPEIAEVASAVAGLAPAEATPNPTPKPKPAVVAPAVAFVPRVPRPKPPPDSIAAPETQAETLAAEVSAPEILAPEILASEILAPEILAPEISAPEGSMEAAVAAIKEPPGTQLALAGSNDTAMPEIDRLEMAIAPFRPLLKAGKMTDLDLAELLNERGKSDFVKGLYERAIEEYDAAIHVKPDFAGAYYNRGVAFEAMGESVRAKQDFGKAYDLGFRRLGTL